MREEKLNFGIIIRVFVSLLPILFGMPTLAIILCSYNLAMSFMVFGPLTALVSSLCSICISMFLGGSYGPKAELSGLVWALQAILCSGGAIYGFIRKRKFALGLSYATIGFLTPQFIYLQYSAHLEGVTIAQTLVPSVEELKSLAEGFFANIQPNIDSSIFDRVLTITHSVTTMLIPSTLIVSSMVIAYIVLWAISVQMRKLPIGIVHSFSHIKVSRLTVVFLTISIIFVTVGLAWSDKMILTVALNMLVVLSSMCFFAGMSLIDYFARKFIPFTFLRIILHAIISLNVFFIYIIAAFVDSFANFRKLPVIYKKRGEANEAEKGNA